MKSQQPATGKNAASGRPDPTSGGQAGFTLVEVIMALSIFAIGLLAVASMQMSALTVNRQAKWITERANIAQDKLEELTSRAYGNSDLDLTAGVDKIDNTDVPEGYALAWSVENGPVANTKRITVKVTRAGRETTMSTIKPEL